MSALINISGWNRLVSEPNFSEIHIGVSPSGASDLFSYNIGKKLINQEFTCHEIVTTTVNTVVTALEDCYIYVTGARSVTTSCTSYKEFYIAQGNSITLDMPQKGFRRYVFAFKKHQDFPKIDFDMLYSWQDTFGKNVRIIRSLESHTINMNQFLSNRFMLEESTPMAFKISPTWELDKEPLEMVSSPVCLGTIQMSPNGFYALGAMRQTVGGYPRVATIIGCDMDILAQYRPRQYFGIKEVSVDEMLSIIELQKSALDKI